MTGLFDSVARVQPPSTLLYTSVRGGADVSWVISLAATGEGSTRVHLRLRVGPVRRRRLVEVGGGLFDLLTIAGLAAGLRERVT